MDVPKPSCASKRQCNSSPQCKRPEMQTDGHKDQFDQRTLCSQKPCNQRSHNYQRRHDKKSFNQPQFTPTCNQFEESDFKSGTGSESELDYCRARCYEVVGCDSSVTFCRNRDGFCRNNDVTAQKCYENFAVYEKKKSSDSTCHQNMYDSYVNRKCDENYPIFEKKKSRHASGYLIDENKRSSHGPCRRTATCYNSYSNLSLGNESSVVLVRKESQPKKKKATRSNDTLKLIKIPVKDIGSVKDTAIVQEVSQLKNTPGKVVSVQVDDSVLCQCDGIPVNRQKSSIGMFCGNAELILNIPVPMLCPLTGGDHASTQTECASKPFCCIEKALAAKNKEEKCTGILKEQQKNAGPTEIPKVCGMTQQTAYGQKVCPANLAKCPPDGMGAFAMDVMYDNATCHPAPCKNVPIEAVFYPEGMKDIHNLEELQNAVDSYIIPIPGSGTIKLQINKIDCQEGSTKTDAYNATATCSQNKNESACLHRNFNIKNENPCPITQEYEKDGPKKTIDPFYLNAKLDELLKRIESKDTNPPIYFITQDGEMKHVKSTDRICQPPPTKFTRMPVPHYQCPRCKSHHVNNVEWPDTMQKRTSAPYEVNSGRNINGMRPTGIGPNTYNFLADNMNRNKSFNSQSNIAITNPSPACLCPCHKFVKLINHPELSCERCWKAQCRQPITLLPR